jgi:hypothetical protein
VFSQMLLMMIHANLTQMRHLSMLLWSSLLAMTWYVPSSQILHHDQSSSQSLNIVESPRLRRIFKMLRADLKESEIPSRMTIRARITEIFEDHLDRLEKEMKVLIHFMTPAIAQPFLGSGGEDLVHYGYVV